LTNKAAPPNNAAAPTAPVSLAAAPFFVLLLAAAVAPPVGVKLTATCVVLVTKSTIVVVGVGTPLVNGTVLADEAPLNAPAAAASLSLEEVVVLVALLGLSTESIICNTPPPRRMSEFTTRAELTKTVPLEMVMVRLLPPRVGRVVLLSSLL